jgi:hypothetical protein
MRGGVGWGERANIHGGKVRKHCFYLSFHVRAKHWKLNRLKFARCSPSRAQHQINHDQGSGEEKKVFKKKKTKEKKT